MISTEILLPMPVTITAILKIAKIISEVHFLKHIFWDNNYQIAVNFLIFHLKKVPIWGDYQLRNCQVRGLLV